MSKVTVANVNFNSTGSERIEYINGNVVVFTAGTLLVNGNTVGSGGGTSVTTSLVTGTTQTAVKDGRYILTNAAATTVTLPASPILGDTVYVTVANGLATNIIARNGNKIMGLNEDMTIDIANTSVGLVYADTNLGWRII